MRAKKRCKTASEGKKRNGGMREEGLDRASQTINEEEEAEGGRA